MHYLECPKWKLTERLKNIFSRKKISAARNGGYTAPLRFQNYSGSVKWVSVSKNTKYETQDTKHKKAEDTWHHCGFQNYSRDVKWVSESKNTKYETQ